MKVDHELDVRGTTCPLPVLRLRRLLARIGSGEVVRVVVGDAQALADIVALVRRDGHELVEDEPTSALGAGQRRLLVRCGRASGP